MVLALTFTLLIAAEQAIMSSDSDGGRDIIYLRTEGVSGNGVPQRLRHLNSPETRALPTDISSQHVDDGPPTSINRNRVSLLGGAFATLKQEKRYRGAQVGAKTIEVSPCDLTNQTDQVRSTTWSSVKLSVTMGSKSRSKPATASHRASLTGQTRRCSLHRPTHLCGRKIIGQMPYTLGL